MKTILASPLTRASFARYGDVLDTAGWENHYTINSGKCERYHALARAEAHGPEAKVVLSIFKGTPYALPLRLGMVERHPLGSQAFMPLGGRPYLVIVCADGPDGPMTPEAFLARGDQGVNYPPNRWHGVLTPIGEPQDFLVVDRGGGGVNLEEHHFPEPCEIRLPKELWP